MSTDLAGSAEWLKRTVATPGNFATFYPNTTDLDVTMTLLDGLSEAQLDGFFLSPMYLSDEDGVVTPDLTRPQLALVVLYAGVRFMRAELLNRKNHVRYEAKGVVSETEQFASVITQLLKDATARLAQIILLQQQEQTATAFWVADAYVARAVGYSPVSRDAIDLAFSSADFAFGL